MRETRTLGGTMPVGALMFIAMMLLLVFVLLAAYIVSHRGPPVQKNGRVPGHYGEEADKKELIKMKMELQSRILDSKWELLRLRHALGMIEMDLEAINAGLTFKYIQIPNLPYVVRVEFNSSAFDDVEVTIKNKRRIEVTTKNKWRGER